MRQTSSKPSSNNEKLPKLSKRQREAATIALAAQGLNNGQIAQKLGLERKTVGRYLQENKPVSQAVDGALDRLNAALDKVITIEEQAGIYAKLAKDAKNEAVGLAANNQIAEFRGVVTEKERLRAKGADPAPVTPMFVLPAGATVQVSVARPREVIETTAVKPDDEG